MSFLRKPLEQLRSTFISWILFSISSYLILCLFLHNDHNGIWILPVCAVLYGPVMIMSFRLFVKSFPTSPFYEQPSEETTKSNHFHVCLTFSWLLTPVICVPAFLWGALRHPALEWLQITFTICHVAVLLWVGYKASETFSGSPTYVPLDEKQVDDPVHP
jgi:hypothetical protein